MNVLPMQWFSKFFLCFDECVIRDAKTARDFFAIILHFHLYRVAAAK